jgi:hypothetical protein
VPPTNTPTTSTATPVLATDAGTGTTVQDASVRVLGEPWEDEGVSLVLNRLAVNAASDSAHAAARTWFRLFNKTGQRLLVEIDWNNIHLEDSLGNRYVDWKGGGTTSVWVESGRSYDFNREYAQQPNEFGRVPTDVASVQVVVDEFSRIKNARWQMDLNPTLVPLAAPDPETVKGISEDWEQDGLALELDRVDVRAESDSAHAAVRVWFTLTNHTDKRRLAEVDLSYIYVMDSLGRRFVDWDGGGLITKWLDPGKSLDFNREYSEMSNQRSRVTQGAEFVLVRVEQLGPIENVQWQFDIVR